MDFEARLKKLSALIGSPDHLELFNIEYEAIHNDLAVHPGPRYEMLLRLRRLADHQLEFLMNGWIREDRKQWQPGWVR